MDEDITLLEDSATQAAWALAAEDANLLTDPDAAFFDDSENLYLTPT